MTDELDDKTTEGTEETGQQKEGTENTGTENNTGESQKPEENEDLKKANDELEKLKLENESLKEKSKYSPSVSETSKTISPEEAISTLRSLTDEQYEDKFGAQYPNTTRKEVIGDLEKQVLTKRLDKQESRIVVGDAIDEAISANPKLIRLKGAMKDFINEYVPISDRGDPEKIKKHLKKAETYAKGIYGDSQKETKMKSSTGISPNQNNVESKKKEDEELSHIDKKSRIKVSKYSDTTGSAKGVTFDDWN